MGISRKDHHDASLLFQAAGFVRKMREQGMLFATRTEKFAVNHYVFVRVKRIGGFSVYFRLSIAPI
jgi:hypothetical protein